MGENALATLVELGHQLAWRRHHNQSDLDTENVIFLDVLGLAMVSHLLDDIRIRPERHRLSAGNLRQCCNELAK